MAPKLTPFAAPQGGASAPSGGRAAQNMTTPQLTPFAAPQGGASAPSGGRAAPTS